MTGTSTPRLSRSLRIISGTAAAASSVLTVTRTSCEPAWASRATWIAVASGVGGVRVGHRLDDDRVRRPDEHAADVDGDRRPADGPERVRRCHGVPPPNWRAMSNTVIQIRNVNRATNPIA